MLSAFIIYLLLGVVAGVLAGLLGVGGGLVIVPVLAWQFAGASLATEHLMHLAIGSSLATMMLTSLSSVWAHHRHGAVRWPVVRSLAPGLVLGGLAGAWLADQLATASLRRLFGLFEILVAVQMLLALRPAAQRGLPGALGLPLAGGVIGSISALFGIGGGTLTVPFLLWCGVSIREAVASSAACGWPIAVAGALGFMLAGRDAPGLPGLATGYVYWPAVAGIVLTSVLSAPLGARLAHGLPMTVLRRVFALFLALVGGKLLLT